MNRHIAVAHSTPQWIHVALFTFIFEAGVVAAMAVVAGVA